MSYFSLPFGLIRKEEKSKLDLLKNYGASQYIKRLSYISREDPSFQNPIIDIINNRSDLRKFTNKNNNDNDDNINFNFDDGDDDDNDDDMDADDLLRKYDNLRRQPIPKPRPEKYEDELLCRYDRLKPKTDESDLLRKFNKLKRPVFRDIPPWPPSLKRKDYSNGEESFIMPGPLWSSPQPPPRRDILQTNFDQPITNLIDKANNVIAMVPKYKKGELDKLDLHLSTQLSKLFPEVEDGTKIIGDKNDEKINELPILQVTEILSKIDEGEVPKQLDFSKVGENIEFENMVKSIGLHRFYTIFRLFKIWFLSKKINTKQF